MSFAVLKLDMAKEYDHMEWGFIESMLLKLGFAHMWVDLIMLCVTTVKYVILVNGECTCHITPIEA